MILFKIFVVFVLMLPALLLTGLIWVFGGWSVDTWSRPNPAFALVEWMDK